jgi:hypothetical protein
VQEGFHHGRKEGKDLGLVFLNGTYCLAALPMIFVKVK